MDLKFSVACCILAAFIFQTSEAIFFTTVGLTGTAATTAVITQSAALLPVLGLLALAAKVTKLKLANQQEQGYGSSHGGGYGYGGGGHGGYISSGYGHGHGGGYISSGYGHGGGSFGGGHGGGYGGHHYRSAYDRKGRDLKPPTVAKVPRTYRHKRNVAEADALEDIFRTIDMLDNEFDCVKLHLCNLGRDSLGRSAVNASDSTPVTASDAGLINLMAAKCPSVYPGSSMAPYCKAFHFGMVGKTNKAGAAATSKTSRSTKTSKPSKLTSACEIRFSNCNFDSDILSKDLPLL